MIAKQKLSIKNISTVNLLWTHLYIRIEKGVHTDYNNDMYIWKDIHKDYNIYMKRYCLDKVS